MNAGALRYPITILQPSVTFNDFGQQVETYTQYKTTKAQVIWGSGNKAIENDEEVFNYGVTFTIRNYHQVMERMRVEYRGKVYRILTIEDDERAMKKNLICQLIND